MKAFLDALSFLTIIRIPTRTDFDGAGAVRAFSLVGVVVGGMLAGVYIALGHLHLSPILLLLFLVVITGALHLDGVADSADGLFSHRPLEQKLEIMKDSRVGAMGLIAVAVLLLAKYHAFTRLNEPMLFLLPPVFARFGVVIAFDTLPYLRNAGTGKSFFCDMPKTVYLQGLIPVALSALCGLQVFLVLNVTFFLFVFFIIRFYRKQMGGITGDMLGAMIELTETVLFLAAAEVVL